MRPCPTARRRKQSRAKKRLLFSMQKQRKLPQGKPPRSRRSSEAKSSLRQPRRTPEAVARGAKGLPSEAQIVEFIGTAEGRVGKREISRAFGIKGNDRIALKQLLKRLESEGKLARKARKLTDATRLPPVAVLEIVGSDEDGELIAIPVEWDEMETESRPRVLVEMRQAKGAREDLQPPGRGD